MKLKREITLFGVFSISTGAMISSGIFVLPSMAYSMAGPSVILSYLIAGVIAVAGVLSVAELATAMPKSGGSYFFIARSLGPVVGTVAGFLIWFSLALKGSFALIGMSVFVVPFVDLNVKIVAIFLLVVFVALNLSGIKSVERFQIILAGLLLVLMFLYVVVGVGSVDVHRFVPFAPNGWGRVLSTAGFVFVSYGGLLKTASLSEEVKNPSKNIPIGMMLSLGVVMVLYSLVVFVTVGVLEPAKLSGTLTPISDGAESFLGTYGRIALSFAAILAFISTANAGIMTASRYPLALSRDKLAPDVFSRVSRKGVPYVSVLFTGFLMALSLLLDLKVLVESASVVILLTYALTCLSVIILRESKIQNYQPTFKSPFYPWVQVIGIVLFVSLIIEVGIESVLMTLGFIGSGFGLYLLYGRKEEKKEYALMHIVERVVNKEITSGSLEEELKHIIRERDNIVEDRFDRLVELSPVLDLSGPMDFEEMFDAVSKTLGSISGVYDRVVYGKLLSREKESTTAITPFVAIPHIIIEGEKKFYMVIVRVKNGVHFSEEFPQVRAVFVLAGTRDERNFHLKALSAIAQIIQKKDFPKRWLEARDGKALKDMLLTSKRLRI